MHTHHQQIAALLYRHCAGETLTGEEQGNLNAWLKADPRNQEVLEKLQQEDWLQHQLQQWAMMEKEKATDWQTFAEKMEGQAPMHGAPVRRLFRPWMKYAAALLLLAGVVSVWLVQKEDTIKEEKGQMAVTDIKPGREGAMLTLADGKKILLDSLGNGWQMKEKGTTLKLENGSLAYQPGAASEVTYNTISTPRGRQFHVQLPDGSHAWLNAASSLTYPTAFTGSVRQVRITGEVYFEVNADHKQPFYAQIDEHAAVEVLGTRFNVNAYSNESLVRTTLVEGSVRVRAQAQQVLLRPGQQAVYQANASDIRVLEADTEQELAWKNGFFNFNNEDIPAFLRQLERWYDIDVIIDGTIPSMKFKGGLDRANSLSEILKVLSKLNIPYKLEGRILKVGNK